MTGVPLEDRNIYLHDVALDEALASWHALPLGQDAAVIGHMSAQSKHVSLATSLGGERVIDELEDDPLPRIC